jgi:hypothetical protein
MAIAVGSGAMLKCSFGTAPGTLTVLPAGRVTADGVPVATILDHQPNVNIAPFGVCLSLTNPQVAAATSAALGVLTPQPCIPVTVAPWVPGATTTSIGGQPVLTNSSTCNCTWAGVISISKPGTKTCQVS